MTRGREGWVAAWRFAGGERVRAARWKFFTLAIVCRNPELDGKHEGHRLMFDYLSRSV